MPHAGSSGSLTNLNSIGVYNLSSEFADVAFQAALDLFNGISGRLTGLPTQSVVPVPAPVENISDFVAPTVPITPTISTDFPVIPDAPPVPTIGGIDIPDPPVLDATKPVIGTLTPPDAFSKAAPADPTLLGVTLPAEPSDAIPNAPLLDDLVLPKAPIVVFPTFDATMRNAPDDLVAEFTFTEPGYTSPLLDDLKTQFRTFFSGQPLGLKEEVWQASWDRARDQQLQTNSTRLNGAAREFASRGFSLPNGALVNKLDEIRQENAVALTAQARDQAIERGQQEINQLNFGIQQGITLEIQLQTQNEQVVQRAFEVQRLTTQFAIDVYNANIAKYQVEAQVFEIHARVFASLLQAEVAKITLFKEQIEAQKIIGDLNEQRISIYRAQIDAVIATFTLFESKLNARRFTLEQNAQSLQLFATQIQRFAAEAEASRQNFLGFESRVQAEKLKVDIFAVEIQAGAVETDAWKSLVDGRVSEKTIELDIERFAFEAFNSVIAGLTAQISGIAEEARAIATIFDAEVRGFSAEVDAETARVGSEVATFEALITSFRATVDAAIADARVRADQVIAQLGLAENSVVAGARIAGQIASSALAQQNFSHSEGFQESSSHSTSVNFNNSTQRVDYHFFDETKE